MTMVNGNIFQQLKKSQWNLNTGSLTFFNNVRPLHYGKRNTMFGIDLQQRLISIWIISTVLFITLSRTAESQGTCTE